MRQSLSFLVFMTSYAVLNGSPGKALDGGAVLVEILDERLLDRHILLGCDFDDRECDICGYMKWSLQQAPFSTGNFSGLESNDPLGNVSAGFNLTLPSSGPRCLHFTYRMFRDVGRLTVYVEEYSEESKLYFVRLGTLGDKWHYEEVDINGDKSTSSSQLHFLYESVAFHRQGSVGVDNIFVTEGRCDTRDQCFGLGVKPYRGTKSVTLSGKSCSTWNANEDSRPKYGSGASLMEDNADDADNRCRVLGSSRSPTCLTDRDGRSEEPCSVAECDLPEGNTVRLLPLIGMNIRDAAAISRVEVYHDGQWGTLCSQEWEDVDAQVLCREMGFPGTGQALRWQNGWPRAIDSPIWLSGLRCRGNESSILDCDHSDWAITYGCSESHYDDAYIRCAVTEEEVECGPHAYRLQLHSQTRESVCVCEEGFNYNETEGQCTGSCPLLYPGYTNFHWNPLNCRGFGNHLFLERTFVTGEGYEKFDGRNRERDEVNVKCGLITTLGFGTLSPFNVAEGKPAFQERRELERWTAHRAVDGRLARHPDDCARLEGDQAWLVVDLEESYDNMDIQIWTPKYAWCKDLNLNGTRPFSILVSDTYSPQWTYQSPESEGFTACVHEEGIHCGQILSTSCPTRGRYVMISISTDPAIGYFPICEFIINASGERIWDYGNSTETSLVPPMMDGGRLLAMVYPGDRQDNIFNCRRWFITAPMNMAIGFYITKWSLSMEKSWTYCQRNVMIYEAAPDLSSVGDQSGKIVLAKLCQPIGEVWVNSSTNMVNVEMTNDKVQDLVIFEAIFRPIAIEHVVTSSGCGSTRRLPFGEGSFHPDILPDDIQNGVCIMELETVEGQFLSITIHLKVYPYRHDPKCKEKALSVVNGTGSVLFTLCTSGVVTLVTPTNKAIVKYSVNVPSSRVFDFTFTYETTSCMGCGGGDNVNIIGSNEVYDCSAACGTVINPQQLESPRLYPAYTTRTYHIHSPVYTWIKLKFNYLNLHSTQGNVCNDYSDRLIVYHDDPNLPSTRRTNICGRLLDDQLSTLEFTSDKNRMTLVFTSSGGIEKTSDLDLMGFSAYWDVHPVQKSHEDIHKPGFVCPSGWNQLGESCYKLMGSSRMINWFEAEESCRAYTGHLVSIHSTMEMEYLHDVILLSADPSMGIYIGLRKIKSQGIVPEYRWVDGSPLTYTDWDRGQPSGWFLECSMFNNVKYSSTSIWYDAPCASNETSQYLCEISAESSENSTEIPVQSIIGPKGMNGDIHSRDSLYLCDNREYILSPLANDGLIDCSDGSDEQGHVQKEGVCKSDEFLCDGKRCIKYAFKCDLINHCFDGTDERGCVFPDCQHNEFMCKNKKCIPDMYRCDAVKHCSLGEDEEFCVTEHHHMFECQSGDLIPKGLRCDGFRDCPLREDESECEDESVNACGSNKSPCLLKPGCFSKIHRCVLAYDVFGLPSGCRDLTHLRNCESFQCPPATFKCYKSYCISLELRCDGKTDCPDGDDERSCTVEDVRGVSRPIFACPGGYRCQQATKCIPLTKRCDWLPDCPNGDDELLCDFTCPKLCNCNGAAVNCSSQRLKSLPKLPWQTRILYLNDNFLDNQALIWLEKIPFLRKLFLTNNKVHSLEVGAFPSLPNLEELDLSNNNLKRTETVLSHLPQLLKLNIKGNKISRLTEDAFCGASTLQELDISDQRIGEVHPKSFSCLQSSLEQIVADDRVFCCMSGMTDSAQCQPPSDGISSCQQLLASSNHRTCAWLVGILIILSNSALIIIQACKKDLLSKTSSILTYQITLADLLIGMYLLLIASADTFYKDNYAFNDSKWRYSGTCAFTGFLSCLSREAALMFLVVLATEELLGQNQMMEQRSSLRKELGKVLSFVVLWILAGILAILPVFPIRYFDGEFYARSALCFGVYWRGGGSDEGWAYAVAVFVGLNLCLCVALAGALVAILFKARHSYPGCGMPEPGEMRRSVRMGAVMTVNLLLWTIVTFLALTAATHTKINGELYAWTVLLLYPLPALVNPAIYLLTAIKSTKKSSQYLHSTLTLPSSTKAKLCHRELAIVSQALRMETEDRDHQACITRLSSLLGTQDVQKNPLSVQDKLEVIKAVCRTLCHFHNNHLPRPALLPEQVILVHRNEGDYEDSQCVFLSSGPASTVSQLYEDGTLDQKQMTDLSLLIQLLIKTSE